ncbi:UDP-N-acetylglucosamine 2-epimerase [Bordetella genomosp. 12]|uniref:UDP-N-acetylglucosamine 2-epimerase (Hydrolyzing) n=1 Tax=Bordetella genomosp. 12 TaxID=463035 RepID=A0A261VWH2_9BORD|nr:UDP-N-acetylglucosamine 2-epimerase [Bordetella genomosp. 12]OZI77643.1 UDP-N-acetylglucosamine 2-epimerase (hydrolyzing) [Bordetella genomosp. 12]
MKRKVCVVTATRAEYGLVKWLMRDIAASSSMQLQILVTGAHLSPEFGSTYREIEADGFSIDAKVEMLLSADSHTAISKSMGLGLMGVADALERLNPDIIVILGDRYEMLSVASAALIAKIPVAHLHGGETTEGAFDEAIRHAVTKMSHLHFTGTEEYRRRVIQLGEAPDRVHMVGGLGIDAIRRVSLLSKADLEVALGFKFHQRNLLVTFHPVTLAQASSEGQMAEMLAALESLSDTGLIFTMPNADTGGRALASQVSAFVARNPNRAIVFSSLGQLRYLSCLQFVDGVVGNSSSGIAEAPTFKIGTLNIGDRQKGRLASSSVINCEPTRESILEGLRYLFSDEFKAIASDTVNPYGDGGASKRVAAVLDSVCLENLVAKKFYDVNFDPR